MKDHSLTIKFRYPYTMNNYKLFPENIGVGLARFGGTLAALRFIMIVMHWINRRQFERKLTKFLHKEKPKVEGLQESSTLVSRSRVGDTYRRNTFNIQDEENIESDSLLNTSADLSQLTLPTAEESEIKKRYSIEMFEKLIQTAAI
jgi:hypothetical protein